MTEKLQHKHCTPEQLYLKMLEIGSECISCGTNLTKIKAELLTCNLITDDEDDTTLKIIFQNSFTHDETNTYYGNYCKAPEPEFECNPQNQDEYDKLTQAYKDCNHEYECTWFLTPEALMNLLRLKEAEKNRKTSRNTRNISYASLGVAGCILLANLLSMIFPKSVVKDENVKSIQSAILKIDTAINDQSKLIYHLDSIDQVKDSIQTLNVIGKTNLEEIHKSIKSINWKILQIKREIENE
ncbi:hypothetical protein [Portibacter lacus]|uniref:Uncharacterized protein n=1 Tax=Portibacter lacus TaxID=1099794 RepID=A0AA37SLF4_9BACT|nr:hypothetical protein [Portibacter lacus]GLR16165.1 hypothetical protein GCM10007940_07800 [Portibacter lacus]